MKQLWEGMLEFLLVFFLAGILAIGLILIKWGVSQ